MKQNTPGEKYYLSPVSGRVIKESGKIFRDLKKRRYTVDPHDCLYNIASVKKCVEQIKRRYSFVEPGSGISDMPHAVFTGDSQNIFGIVSGNNKIYKLNPEQINVVEKLKPHASIPVVKTVTPEDSDLLEKLVSSKPAIENKEFYKLLHTVPSISDYQSNAILFNPKQNDFVPVGNEPESKYNEILDFINNTLIPMNLPKLAGTEISGLATNQLEDVLGFIQSDNTVSRLEVPMYNEKSYEHLPKVTIPKEIIESAPISTVSDTNTLFSNSPEVYCGYTLEWDSEFQMCRPK